MARRKIVIVDDDRETRDQLQAVLQGREYDVVQAQTGLRLISYLRVDRPDLILLDVMMSWIDGFELCRAVKQNPEYAGIPVVFISGRGDAKDIEQGMACGAAAYFVKPLDIEALLGRIAALTEPGPATPAR